MVSCLGAGIMLSSLNPQDFSGVRQCMCPINIVKSMNREGPFWSKSSMINSHNTMYSDFKALVTVTILLSFFFFFFSAIIKLMSFPLTRQTVNSSRKA